MLKHFTAVAVLTLVMTGPALGQAATIERLAPEKSVLIAGVRDASGALERLKRTPLWALWHSEEMQAMRRDHEEEIDAQMDMFFDMFGVEDMDQLFEELGVERDALCPPLGAAGLAWSPVSAVGQLGTELGMFAFADYGENAERFGGLVDAVIQRMERDQGIRYDEQDVLGHRVLVFDISREQPDVDFGDIGMDDMGGMAGGPLDGFAEFDKLHYARAGNVFLVSSHMESMRHGLEMLEGDEIATLGQREDFRGTLRPVGDTDAYAVLLTRDLAEAATAADPMVAMAFTPMLKALLGDVRGLAWGVRFDAPRAMVHMTSAMHLPNGKSGIMALMDTQSPREAPPAFVGHDAVSYTRMNFEFDGLMDVIRNVVASNPLLQMQAGEGLIIFENTVGPILATLDKELHVVQSLRRPLEVDSLSSFVAVRCKQPEAFETAFAAVAPELGLEPRDFAGHRIYAMGAVPAGPIPGAAGGLAQLTVGIGGGFVFMGQSGGVEQALRSIADNRPSALVEEPAFRRSVANVSEGQIAGWGYTLPIDSMEASIIISQMQMREMMRQWAQEMPEAAAEFPVDEESPWEKLDWDVIRRYIGPASWDLRSTDDGFVADYYLLGAEPTTGMATR